MLRVLCPVISIAMVRVKLEDQRKRRALFKYFASIKCKETARRYLSRCLAKGDTMEAITNKMVGGCEENFDLASKLTPEGGELEKNRV